MDKILEALFEKAIGGDVQASRLLLEHHQKLQRNVNITIDSPFEKFMKAQNTEFVDVTPQESSKMDEISEELEGVYENLPERNEINDSPRKREKEERGRVVNILKSEKDKLTKRNYQKKAYELRKRAKNVGLDLLPNGRQPKGARKEWLRRLEELEKQKKDK